MLLYYWLYLNAPPHPERAERAGLRRADAWTPPPVEHRLPSHVRLLRDARQREAALSAGRRAPVMVVDPDVRDRERTVDALAEIAGMDPIAGVASAEEAVRFLTQHGVCKGANPVRCPNLVLLEMDQPNADGLEILKTIRAEVDHRVAVVVFTHVDDPELIHDCYRLEANSVVRKPETEEDYAGSCASSATTGST